MGDIAQGIFGGSKSKSTQSSESGNKAFETLSPGLSAQSERGNSAGDLLAGLLGMGDTGAAGKAFNTYKDSSAYNFLQSEGTNAITNSQAAKGLLNSGSTARGISDRAQNVANTFQNDYLDRLLGLGTQGNQSAGILSDAGKFSKSQGQSNSSEKPGIAKFLGQVGAGVAMSDSRLKTNIKKLGEMYDGLGLYAWNYIWGGKQKIGVMADEVKRLRPWALGPTVEGYMTVNYGEL